MAHTRAISRAGRNCLDWVVVLAGFSATPFEEMPRESEHPLPSSGPRQNQRQQASAPTAPSPDRETGEYCETHQVNWFKTIKMKGFAHPIEGEKTPSGGTIWCNYKPAPPPPPEVIDNLDDLNDIGDEHQA